MSTETLENKYSNARSKFLIIIWLTDKATIPIGRSKMMKNRHRISSANGYRLLFTLVGDKA
jgi:hypothetical protein